MAEKIDGSTVVNKEIYTSNGEPSTANKILITSNEWDVDDIQNISSSINDEDSKYDKPLQTINDGNWNIDRIKVESFPVEKTCANFSNYHDMSGSYTSLEYNSDIPILEGCPLLLTETNEKKAVFYYLIYGVIFVVDLAIKCLKNLTTQIMMIGSLVYRLAVNKSKISQVVNTCAFDSVLQVIILTLAENKTLRKALEKSDNPFIQLAELIIVNGFKNTYVFQLQTNLLYKYFEKDKQRMITVGKHTTLNCAISIPYAILLIFRNDPSCEEFSKCANGCTNLPKKRASITITYKSLFDKNFSKVINDCLSLPKYPCQVCTSVVETTLEKTGKYIC